MGWLADFDRVSRVYDLLPIPTHPEALAERLEGLEGPLVDVGGGTGRFTERLVGEPRLVLDPSAGMLARARERGLGAVRGVGQAAPLASGTVGAVTVTEAFHHFEDQRAVLREAARVLRGDGVLLIEEIDPTSLLGRAVELGEHLIGFQSTFLEPGELAADAAEVFEAVTVEATGPLTYLLEARTPRADAGDR